MGLSKNYFIELQEMYQANSCSVEKVRLGDVMFQIESKKLALEQLIEKTTLDQIQFTNMGKEQMASYCQTQIDAYKLCQDLFDDLYSDIKRIK